MNVRENIETFRQATVLAQSSWRRGHDADVHATDASLTGTASYSGCMWSPSDVALVGRVSEL